jgi:hypothetical protein
MSEQISSDTADAAAKQPATPVIDAAVHRKLAVDLFNQTWDLIDKSERTAEEDATMIHTAHASLYHWSKVGTVSNLSVGEWQVAHVYTILRHGQAALYHAQRCVDLTTENTLVDWQVAFAYEALARAYAAQGNAEACKNHRTHAAELGTIIEKEGERRHFETELAKEPWFGV